MSLFSRSRRLTVKPRPRPFSARRCWRGIALCLGVALATPWGNALASCTRTYLVSAVPQKVPTAHIEDWQPLVKRLEKDSGVCLRLYVPISITDFSEHLLQGKPDFAYMNPLHMVRAHQAHGYVPLLRNGSEPLVGILVSRADRVPSNLKELDGQVIAFPAPEAFAASILVRALLDREGVSFKPIYLNSHEAVYRAVLMGDAVAGGGIMTSLGREPERVRESLAVIKTTLPSAPHPLAVHPRVPLLVREKIVAALMAMSRDASGADSLRRVGLSAPVTADYARDYQALETMKPDCCLPPSIQ